MTSGHWWFALLGLGCLFVLAWAAYQFVRHPDRFDADLARKYLRGEIDWHELERRQRAHRRQRRSQRGS